MRILILVVAVLVGLSIMAGCSNSEAGTPRAERTSNGTSSDSAGSTPAPTSTASDSPLADIDPCELLSDADRAQLGVGEGEPKRIVGSETCKWLKSGDFLVGVALKTDLAFKDADLRGATPTRVDIGRHEAYRVEATGGARGTCEVYIVTGESSFAQANAGMVTSRDTAMACEKVLAFSKIIDPKLP